MAFKIAICGKGGAGKTTVSALLLKAMQEVCPGKKVLAIDADPAQGLALALGMTPDRTLEDIRQDMITSLKKGAGNDRNITLKTLEYELFAALEQKGNIAFLSIGRPEDEGCFCRLNTLLKDVIDDLACRFDFVLIDGEAGVEQINRRVINAVDVLLVVTDTSARSMNVARTIYGLAEKEVVKCSRMFIVANRVYSGNIEETLKADSPAPVIGMITDEKTIREYDAEAKSLMMLPDDIRAKQAAKFMLRDMIPCSLIDEYFVP
jgi:CO dehydrogenase maturation factor